LRYDQQKLAGFQIHPGNAATAEKVQQPNIVSLYLPIEDVAPISIKHIRQGFDSIREHKQLGNRVLFTSYLKVMRLELSINEG
jgi:hypothetical protein